MSVLLSTLVEPLKRKCNPPGVTDFLSATDAEWQGRLADAFWIAKLKGYFADFRVDPLAVAISNTEDGDDLTEELQILIVLVAALTALELKLFTLPMKSRQVAPGPLENEVQRSAQLLIELIKGLRNELAEVKILLLGTIYATDVGVIDMVLAREDNILWGEGYFLR